MKEKEQVAPHEMPEGAELTVPLPVPAFVTERGKVIWVKVAVTERLVESVRLQVRLVPAQAPDQPLKAKPKAGAAVNVTEVPVVKLALQVGLQAIPAGEEVIEPDPTTEADKVFMF